MTLLPGVGALTAALGRAGAARGVAGTHRRPAAVLRDREEVAGLGRADDGVVGRGASHLNLAALRGRGADRQAGAAELCIGVTRRVVLGVGEARLDLGN